MTKKWMILADDLTGSADSAIAFRRCGLAATVSWKTSKSVEAPDPEIAVLTYNADSRGMSADDAARSHLEALAQHLGPDRILFKKIDSTLRGQPAAETSATLGFLRAKGRRPLGVFAPAFPAAGRTTLNGRVLVSGAPLEVAEVWLRDHSYANSNLVVILSEANIRATSIGLEMVRAEEEDLAQALNAAAAEGFEIVCCDAETDDDLAQIALASSSITPAPFFIGSAGLAHALASLQEQDAEAAPSFPATDKGTLVVVGSRASASRAAAERLATSESIHHVPVETALLLDLDATVRLDLAMDIGCRLGKGQDVLVQIVDDGQLEPATTRGHSLVIGLAEILATAASDIGALAATGGETAHALLSAMGIQSMDLLDEIEPGVPLGLTRGEFSFPVATKAGAFGDADSLCRMATTLRIMSRKGRSS